MFVGQATDSGLVFFTVEIQEYEVSICLVNNVQYHVRAYNLCYRVHIV